MVSKRLIAFLALAVTVNAGLVPDLPIQLPIQLPNISGDNGCSCDVIENNIVNAELSAAIPIITVEVILGSLVNPASCLTNIQQQLNFAFPNLCFTIQLTKDVNVCRARTLASTQSITIAVPLVGLNVFVSVIEKSVAIPTVPIVIPPIPSEIAPCSNCDTFKVIEVGTFFTSVNVQIASLAISEAYTTYAGVYPSITLEIQKQFGIKFGGVWNVIIDDRQQVSTCYQQQDIHAQFGFQQDVITCYR